MTELRILFVATQIQIPGTGGGQTHVGEVVANLRKHGEVLALTRRGSSGDGVFGAGLWPGLPPHGLSHVMSVANLAASLSEVRKFAPNVIYERGSSFGLGSMFSKLLGIPVLTMLLDKHMSPLSLSQASVIVATNPDLVPVQARSKAVKVSWGANTDLFHPGVSGIQARTQYGFESDDFVVGYCGTFQAWHGLDILVDVAKLIPDPSIKFLMIGDHKRAASFIELVEAQGLAARFVFTDRVPYEQVPEALAASDVCVAPFAPSRHKGASEGAYSLDPLKVFEYLALQKPVITIDAENIRKLFDDRKHLRLFPAENAQGLAAVLKEVREDTDGAKQMAKLGQERVVERHTWAAHAEHLASLFRSMLSST